MLSLLRRYRELIIVAGLLVYPFATYLTSGHRGRAPNVVDRAIVWATSPLARALTWAADGLGSGVTGYVALRGVRERNRALERENSELRAEVNSLKEAALENERLRKALAYADTTPEVEIPARVLGTNPVSTMLSVRLNRGEADGVRRGMPVVTPDGVVGRVVRATGGYSDVALITDPSTKIGVRIRRSRSRATASGTGNHKVLRLENLARSEELKDQDEIITNGTDGIYPPGLMVGVVRSEGRGFAGMFQSAEIEPAVDVTRLEEVLVVPVVAADPVPAGASVAREGVR